MKKILLLAAILATLATQAQKSLKQWGMGAQLNYSDVYWTRSTAPTDSLNKLDHGLLSLSPQVWHLFEVDRNLILQVGLQFSMTGHQRRAANVEYQKVYHPDMPVIQDNLHGDPRHIDFFYRNYTLGVPVFFNKEIIGLRKSLSLRYYFSPGISFHFRVSDATIARTRGFGFDGSNRFVLDNMYDTRWFGLQLHLAGRGEYLVSGRYRAQIQPVFNMPLLSTYKGENRGLVPSVGVNVFLTFLPGFEDSNE